MDSGLLQVNSGAEADFLTVSGGASIVVSAGGLLSNATIAGDPGGPAFANLMVLGSGSSRGSALAVTVDLDGALIVRGGLASGTVVDSGGAMTVDGGGKASNTTIDADGSVMVSSGTLAGFTLSSGSLTVGAGGVASGGNVTGIASGQSATETVLAGGLATVTTAASGGVILVGNAGSASFITVSSGGELSVGSGGHAIDTRSAMAACSMPAPAAR